MKRVWVTVFVLVAASAGLSSLALRAAEEENAMAALRDDGANPGGTTAQVRNDPGAATKAAPAAAGASQSYTIVSGDFLSKIAQRFYGDANKWTLIYNANRDKLGSNPDLIYPGVTITIPGATNTDPAPGTGTTNPGTGTGPGGGQANPGNNSGPFAQQRPVDHGRITSNFGPRSRPGGIGSSYHEGMDIAVPTGTPVKATGPGRVVGASRAGGYGNLVKIAHSDGTVTYFGHLQGFNVKVGDNVAAGQQVATSNNTGNSTGPHLHFGVQKNGKFVDPRQNFNFPANGGSF